MNTADTHFNSNYMSNLTSISVNTNNNLLKGESRSTIQTAISEESANSANSAYSASHHLTFSRRKRLFSEMDVDAKGIEKGLSTLTINKKIKINSNNDYIPKTYSIFRKSNAEEIIDNKELDMDREKLLVENYYHQKNKLLFQAMFGNQYN